MLTFAEICLRIAQRLNVLPTDAYATQVIPRMVQDAYKEIWDSEVWDELFADDFTYTLAANSNSIILTKQYGPILKAFNGDTGREIKLMDRPHYSNSAYAVGTVFFKDIGQDAIARQTPAAVYVQPATAQRVKVVSASASDTNQVFISGLDANNEIIAEAIALSGTTPVQSVNTYAYIDKFSKTKKPSVGVTTLTDSATPAVTLATLGVWETTATYQRYMVNGSANTSLNIKMTCKKAFTPFTNAFDYPFTNLDNALLEKALATALQEHRQLELSAAADARSERSLGKVRRRELNQDGVILFVPALRQ